MTDVFVTGTHPFLWHLTNGPRLSEAARQVLERADRGELAELTPVEAYTRSEAEAALGHAAFLPQTAGAWITG